MRRAAAAGGSPVDAAALRLGPGDEFLRIARGHARVDDDHRGRDGDHADGHEVGVGVGHVRSQQAVRDDTGGADEPRVAVGLCLGDDLGADDGARARLVLDDHRLAEALRDGLRRGAGNEVVSAAGAERHHPADRMIGPIGVRGAGGNECGRDGERDSQRQDEAAELHGHSPVTCAGKTDAAEAWQDRSMRARIDDRSSAIDAARTGSACIP